MVDPVKTLHQVKFPASVRTAGISRGEGSVPQELVSGPVLFGSVQTSSGSHNTFP